ncbi:hypothetical protein [Geodermatophilus sp. FMUSA9-8]|uniref:hypothetical protein n=1 Tax=Geodermatophilus sp. FMUSA9-8 TaxID=3120155 RepID=UPI00300B140B
MAIGVAVGRSPEPVPKPPVPKPPIVMPPVASPPVPSRTWAQRHGRVLRLVILAVAFAVVFAVPLVGLSVVGLRRADVILGSFFLAPTAFVTVLLAVPTPSNGTPFN